MEREGRARIHDIAQAISHIEDFTAGASSERYQQDLLLRSAGERQCGIISEALTRVRQRDPGLATRLADHNAIIDFRNVLACEYKGVPGAILRGAVHDGLPGLRRDVEAILAED